MDPQQQQQEGLVLRAIALSSSESFHGRPIPPQDRQAAFQVLTDFKKINGRLPICLSWLQQQSSIIFDGAHDITVPTKLYALDIVQDILQTQYAKHLSQDERLLLRQAVVMAARQHASIASSSNPSARILGNKLASLIAGFVVRDFPQRWTTFTKEIFAPQYQGGLWYDEPGEKALQHMGVRMCLECLKQIAEDCTDSDFNAKISTNRRNDVLIGLNEVSDHFVPLLYQLLEHSSIIFQSKDTLHNMHGYLQSTNATTMTPDELHAYQMEVTKVQQAGMLVADTLVTLEKFCRSMPLDWIFGKKPQINDDGDDDEQNYNGIIAQPIQQQQQQKQQQPSAPTNDMSVAMIYLLREPNANIQVYAIECIEQLCLRGKLSFQQWMKLITQLPRAVQEANQFAALDQERYQLQQTLSSSNDYVSTTSLFGSHAPDTDPLTSQFEFHRSLSRMLAAVLSSHISHVTSDKKVFLLQKGSDWEALSNFFRLSTELLYHPSGRICGEQINVWICLFRDPQISRARLLQPFVKDLLSCYLDHMVRIRWDDVEEQNHPFTSLMEASWDDEEEYDNWLNDMRSKASQLFKFLGNAEPHVASATFCERIKGLMATHGNGEPFDHLHPINKQLTPKSEAIRQLEGIIQPLENVLCGLPSWSLTQQTNTEDKDGRKAQIRQSTLSALNEIAQMLVVQWNPTYLWMKFRRAQLFESMKHYWKYQPSTLLQAIDALLGYIHAPDDWDDGQVHPDGNKKISGEIVGLRKKSSVALVSVSKKVPHHLVPWISQLSQATRNLLSSHDLLPTNRMHLYEFLSCVATAVDDPVARSNFLADVLSDALNIMDSPEVQEAISSAPAFMSSLGITQAADYPASVTDPTNVRAVSRRFGTLFSAFNQLLSVGKRCHEASRKRPNGGIPLHDPNNNNSIIIPISIDDDMFDPTSQNFPDEGPVSLSDLAVNDPFVPLWPRILPNLLKALDVALKMWHPMHQSILLRDRLQRYALAISDDEAYLSKKNDKSGGVFGEGGTAGSVIPGTDRRDLNLVPRWSGWLNELRNTCFQMLGLAAGQRVIFAPEMADLYPQLVVVIVDEQNLQSMEHRHFTQYLKQFVEIFLLSCPSTLYPTHLAPILGPILSHLQYRLDKTWAPILEQSESLAMCKPLATNDCEAAAALASRGGEEWLIAYYARAGLFVGEVDAVTSEAAMEKGRIEITRTFSDVLQAALALKGDWALVLANQFKEEQANRRNDPAKLSQGPRNRVGGDGGTVNADGTPRTETQKAIDARKMKRIAGLCHFLLLGNEQIAGSLTLTVIQCLSYPDAYTCRRMTRICHRVLEQVAWEPRYTDLLGRQMFLVAVKNIVLEPKWMVGIEWDMINVVRDIYGRLVLGQIVQPGGQGAGLQQTVLSDNPLQYEQAKTANRPLQGGGILTVPSDLPRQVLAMLPGITVQMITQLDSDLQRKRSAKDQKDFIRDLLRVAADNIKAADDRSNGGSGSATLGVLDRAVAEESLLHNAHRKAAVEDIPEKLVKAQKKKKNKSNNNDGHPSGLAAFSFV